MSRATKRRGWRVAALAAVALLLAVVAAPAQAATYYVQAAPAVSVGVDGSTTMTTLVDIVVTDPATPNTNRAITNTTAPTGTARWRIGPGAATTGTNEYFRAYTPAYAAATSIAANATAYADFYMRATGGTVTVSAVLYEYNDVTGIVGAAKGTASFTGNTAVTTRQTMNNASFGNAAFTVAAGNRLLVIYRFTTSSSRPAYLWGQSASATPSGYQAFTVTESVAATTTLGNGAAPASATLAPGAAITDLDAFTLVTSAGTDTLTAASVTLTPAGAFNNVGTLSITNSAGNTTYGTNSLLTGDVVTFSGMTLPVTTTPTTFKVRLTPDTHAAMPPVPGAQYATQGVVSAWTVTNTKAGSNTTAGSATLTVDNLSPSDATGLAVTPGGNQLVVNWTNPAADYARTMVLYSAAPPVADVPVEGTIYAAPGALGASTIAYVGGAAGSAGTTTITGLSSGTSYGVKVFVQDAAGNWSTPGAGASVITLPPAPAAPTFSSVTGTSLTAAWTAVTGAASYNLQRATDSGFTANLTTFTGVTSPYADTGPLTPGTTYWYRAVAVNASGSTNGTGASVTTLAPPATPAAPTFSAIAGTSVTVSWTAASGATSYNLQRATDSGFTANLTTLTGVTSPYVDSGLAGTTTYWYRVIAVNIAGSTTGPGASVTTLAGPPSAPGTPTFASVAQTTLTVSWTAAIGATSYNLQRATDSGFTTNLTTFTGVTSPYAASGLTASTTYWFRVVAVNANGTTTGIGASVTTLPNPPGAPGAPTFSNVAKTTLTVSWTAATGATSYNLQRATNSTFTVNLQTFTDVTSPYADSGLTPATTYWYRVVAVNSGGTTTGTASSTTTQSVGALTVAAGTMPAAANVAAGTAGVIVGRIALTSSLGTIYLDSLAVTNAGTATTADIQSLLLLNDATGALVGAASWTGTQWRFSGLSYGVTGTVTLRVVLSLSSGATTGRTFQLTVPAGGVAVLAPDSVNAYTAFSGNLFTVTAGPVEGDATANSTGPVLRIVNPTDGVTVSLTPATATPANAFRAQVYVYNPGGVAALTSVSLSTDNGATWPITMTRNTNYFTGDLNRGIWEANVTTLTPGSYTLRAQAVNNVPKTVLSGQVVIAVNPARRGDGNLLVRDNSGQLCSDCHAIATHSSESTSAKYGSWSTDCRDCHTPHSTTNIYLVKKSITPPAVNGYQGAKTVNFHTTAGDSNSAVNGSYSYANSDNSGPCQVCHTRTSNVAGTTARWRNSGNADTHYTSAAGTQRCTNCHPHTSGFAGGESKGGVVCAGCHSSIWTAMHGSDGVGTGSATHKHSLVGSTDSPTDPGTDWSVQTQLSGVAPASRSCVGMCHGDHPHDLTTPVVATHEYNLYVDPSTAATRASGTASRTNTIRAKTDFDPVTNGGLCAVCHQKPILTTGGTGITVTAASFGNSAHDYTVSTVGTNTYTWNYQLHSGTTDRNCTKCHASRIEGTTPSVLNATAVTAVHGTPDPSLLSGTTNPAGTAAGFVCYNCHGSAVGPAAGAQGNRSGKDIQSQIAHATTVNQSGHPTDSDSVHNSVTENAAAFGNTLGGLARHVNCLDCHDPHEAKAGTHAVTTNLAGPPLQGAWGAQLSNTLGFWTAPGSTHFTKKTIVAGTDPEATLCFKCHSSYYGTLPASPSGGYTETDTAKEFNPANVGNYAGAWVAGETAGGFHPVLASSGNNLGAINMTNLVTTNFAWRTTGARNLMTCTDCHESDVTTDPNGPHGSAAKFILRGPNTVWSQTVLLGTTIPAGTFCLNCHSNTFTGSRYPDHSNSKHSGIPCWNCHARVPHGGPRPGMLVSGAGADAGVGGTIAGWDTTAPYWSGTATNRLYIVSYPANNTTTWAQNNCGCNGTGH